MTSATVPPTPRRSKLLRLANTLFFDGFRAAPGWMTLVTIMLLLGSIASTCYPLGYRLLVDGALSGSIPQAVWGIVVVGVLMSLGWVLTAIGATESMALSDRIALGRTAHLIRLTSGVAGVEHLERPDYLTGVEQLTANRRQLSAAPRQILSNLSSVARIVTLLVLLASVSPWLLLLPICTVPPLLADRLVKRIIKKNQDSTAHVARLATMLFALATEPSSAGEIRAYGLADHLAVEHASLTEQLNRGSTRLALRVLLVQATGWLIYAAGLMGAIAFVAIGATTNLLSLGTVLMAVSLIRRSRNQLASTAQSSGAFVATLATADRLFWLEDYAAAEKAAAGILPAPDQLEQGIRLRDVTFHYPGTENVVLEDLNLDVAAGTTVALVGENGSGKSTLVKLLLGMYRPTSGDILIDDAPLADIDPESWREHSTAAFQDFSRFQLLAVESVGVAELPRIGDEDAAAAALTRAGAGDLVAQLPSGLATEVGTAFTRGHGLSGGQWQKLALGRAMRRQAPLLMVLDEPTASLDAQAEHALFESYARAARSTAAHSGAVTVLVSHRLSTVQTADLIVHLDGGRIIESGSHAQLLAEAGRYAELFRLQAAGFRKSSA
ncbi:MAG TPA: ABC transporter ATP-binding protein [Galbitalea sp.]|jgi:ATP-binding cassette subfamily B protein|nr:ABC transporter ATP-binding protein [Galbitalea sp.]